MQWPRKCFKKGCDGVMGRDLYSQGNIQDAGRKQERKGVSESEVVVTSVELSSSSF